MPEEHEEETGGDYVTREELSAAIADALRGVLGGGDDDGDNDDEGWEVIEDFTEDVGEFLSSADVERIAEEKVQAILRQLGSKKATAKKTAPAKKAAPKKEPEAAPREVGKKSVRSFLWGDN